MENMQNFQIEILPRTFFVFFSTFLSTIRMFCRMVFPINTQKVENDKADLSLGGFVCFQDRTRRNFFAAINTKINQQFSGHRATECFSFFSIISLEQKFGKGRRSDALSIHRHEKCSEIKFINQRMSAMCRSSD